jgi:hypothetical protein
MPGLAEEVTQRWRRRLAAWASTAAVLLVATGCPEAADLENPESFCKPGASVVDASGKVIGCNDQGATAGTGAGMPPAGCETACLTQLFENTCNSCHTSSAPLGGLDLQSAGFTARLKDQAAKHQSVDNPAQCPSGDKLIDSANPAASWLLKKVSGQQGACGTSMPPGNVPVTQAELACVTAYVTCVGGGA